ncbi:MAG: RNA polymerase sigma factor [Limnochordia bacterium]
MPKSPNTHAKANTAACVDAQAPTDAELVVLLQARQSQAVEILLERYHGALLAYAFRLLADRQLAEDVVQEALISCLQNLDKLRDPAKLRSYLYRIVTHGCRDQQRRSAHREIVTDKLPDEALSNPDYTERCYVSELLKQLSPQHKEVLVLRYYEDMDLETIAYTQGIPLGTVKSRLHHALSRLKNQATVHEQKGKAGVLAHEP